MNTRWAAAAVITFSAYMAVVVAGAGGAGNQREQRGWDPRAAAGECLLRADIDLYATGSHSGDWLDPANCVLNPAINKKDRQG